jgi:hypothetical protein
VNRQRNSLVRADKQFCYSFMIKLQILLYSWPFPKSSSELQAINSICTAYCHDVELQFSLVAGYAEWDTSDFPTYLQDIEIMKPGHLSYTSCPLHHVIILCFPASSFSIYSLHYLCRTLEDSFNNFLHSIFYKLCSWGMKRTVNDRWWLLWATVHLLTTNVHKPKHVTSIVRETCYTCI